MNHAVNEELDATDRIQGHALGLEDNNRELRRANDRLEARLAELEKQNSDLEAALLKMRDEQAAKMLKAVEAMPGPTFTPVRCSSAALTPAADLARKWEQLVGTVDLTGDIPLDLIDEGEAHTKAFRHAEATLEKASL